MSNRRVNRGLRIAMLAATGCVLLFGAVWKALLPDSGIAAAHTRAQIAALAPQVPATQFGRDTAEAETFCAELNDTPEQILDPLAQSGVIVTATALDSYRQGPMSREQLIRVQRVLKGQDQVAPGEQCLGNPAQFPPDG